MWYLELAVKDCRRFSLPTNRLWWCQRLHRQCWSLVVQYECDYPSVIGHHSLLVVWFVDYQFQLEAIYSKLLQMLRSSYVLGGVRQWALPSRYSNLFITLTMALAYRNGRTRESKEVSFRVVFFTLTAKHCHYFCYLLSRELAILPIFLDCVF